MNAKLLTDIGLNETQAKAYILLIKSGSLTPPELAEKLQIKRTNAYAVLDQLTELHLSDKKDVRKKISYRATHPIALEKIAKVRRDQALEHEKLVQASLPTLLNFYHSFSDQPGVRFFQGINGIKEIYNDMLRTAKDIYVIRSLHDDKFMKAEFFHTFKKKKVQLGITTYILNPEKNDDVFNEKTDSTFATVRTFVPNNLYTAPVELSTYGDKVSILSFGEEAIGMIIDSPQIAEAMRQVYYLARLGAEHAN